MVRESHPNQIVIAQTNNFAAAADTTCKTGGRRMGERARGGEQPYTEDAGRKFCMRQRLFRKLSSTNELQHRAGDSEFTIFIKGTGGRNTNRILGISGRPWETADDGQVLTQRWDIRSRLQCGRRAKTDSPWRPIHKLAPIAVIIHLSHFTV